MLFGGVTVWRDKACEYYLDYPLDFGNFTIPDIVIETIVRTQVQDTRAPRDEGNETHGQDANDLGEGRDKEDNNRVNLGDED